VVTCFLQVKSKPGIAAHIPPAGLHDRRHTAAAVLGGLGEVVVLPVHDLAEHVLEAGGRRLVDKVNLKGLLRRQRHAPAAHGLGAGRHMVARPLVGVTEDVRLNVADDHALARFTPDPGGYRGW